MNPPLSPAALRAREQLEAGRAAVRVAHGAGAGGEEIVRAMSALMDEVLQTLLSTLVAEAGMAGTPLALVAIGGYGRRELAPRSDVDLLALLPDGARGRAEAEQIAERLHRALWDAGLEAGFAARTAEQSMALAREDHTARTALLDCRLVAGDPALYKPFERAVLDLESKRIEEFIKDKLGEMQERRTRFGGSIWLLEPHLKQGKGGLRDLQTALWIARVRHRVAGIGEVGERGLMPAREVAAVRAARDWLWRVRNELHESTGRRDDRLTFDHQIKIAQAFGYTDGEHELAVERLMRETYTALQEISRATDALLDRCVVEWNIRPSAMATSLPELAGALLGKRPPQAKPVDAAFKLWHGRVTVVDKETFARRPADMVRIFSVAETLGAPIYSYARDLLLQELGRIGPALAADRDAHFECWQLFTRDGSDGAQLVAMHELGVLGALFPELQRLRARAQHSLYHVYTVDTHTVFALQRLCRLRAGALVEIEPELTRISRAQERPRALMLGLLFHDLGKGLGGDHSARGVELVRAYAERVGLDPTDAADIAWLVHHHLSMSHISQRRDLDDVQLIEAFARDCATLERLEMLYLLTYADMASVSPENWNGWKAGLLRELYERARAVLLSDGLDAPGHERSLDARRDHLAAQIAPLLAAAEVSRRGPADRPRPAGAPPPTGPRELAKQFIYAAPERYLATVRAGEAARHVALWLDARRSGFAADLHVRESGEAEVALLSTDRPGLLALFSAALAATGIDILAAEVHSLEGNIALDRFVVREPGGGVPSPGRGELALHDLRKLLAGAEQPARLVQRRLRHSSAYASAQPAVLTRLRLDDRSSSRFTVLDVVAQDRPGLLFTIAEALHEAGASIELARVATEGNRATDAFYLSDTRAAGGKLGVGARGEAVMQAVRAAIDGLPI